MPEDAPRPAQAAIRTDLGAIFVSLELSRRTWLITSLSPGGGEKMDQARDSSAWRTLPRVSGLYNIATTRLTHPTVVPISIGIANPRCQSVAK